jgi:hypothetical protein
VVKSCDFGSTVPPPVAAVDCAVDPYDTSCIIDSLVDTGVVDPVEQAIADATDMSTDEETGSDDGSSDGTELFEKEEEFLVADESIEEETDLETILQDDVFDEEDEEIAVAEAASETVSEKTAEPAASRHQRRRGFAAMQGWRLHLVRRLFSWCARPCPTCARILSHQGMRAIAD